jgi:hypothetical protein
MKHLSKTAILFLVLLPALTHQASAEEGAKDAGPPWYEFEVLVFQRIAKGAGSTEFWPDDPGSPSLENVIPFNARGQATLKDNLPIPYRPLPAEERQLGNIWASLRSSRNYRPLYHVAWRQQVVDPQRAQSLYLYLGPESGEPGPRNPPKLEGILKVGVKRYLHLETDLLLRLPVTPEAGDDYFMGPAYRSYRMQAKRRMRSGKLHYLDHPVLGIMFKAERYEPPVPEPVAEPAAATAEGTPPAADNPTDAPAETSDQR